MDVNVECNITQVSFTQKQQRQLAGFLTWEQHDLLDLTYRIGASSSKNYGDIESTLAIMIFAECAKVGIALPHAAPLVLSLVRKAFVHLAGQFSLYHTACSQQCGENFEVWLNSGNECQKINRVKELYSLGGQQESRFVVKTEGGDLMLSEDLSQFTAAGATTGGCFVDAVALANKLSGNRAGPLFTLETFNIG